MPPSSLYNRHGVVLLLPTEQPVLHDKFTMHFTTTTLLISVIEQALDSYYS